MKKIFSKAGIPALALATMFFSCGKDKAMDGHKGSSNHRTFKVENIISPKLYVESGTFKGDGSKEAKDLIMPGDVIEIKFSAGKEQALMFATMYGTSKDWFFAPQNPGIKLYNSEGQAIVGDVSSQIKLWDNGSKHNETGATESKPIAEVSGIDASKLIKAWLSYNAVTSEFTLGIKNISHEVPQHQTPFSPGVWAVSTFDGEKLLSDKPFFTPGQMTNPEISDLSQMGNIAKLEKKVKEETGIITGISPVLLVIYKGTKNPIYELGKKDAGLGLKDFAQKGDAGKLQESLKKMQGVKHVYILGKAPIGPKKSEMIRYQAEEGDQIAYATMFGFSNDWFYASQGEIPATKSANLTSRTILLDSGTGVDQYPGAGNNQALFGGTPQAESKPISKVGNTFPVPSVDKVLKITIE